MKSIQYIGLVFIVALGLMFRLYRWERPLGDWHSWRQVDTASVTREYVKNGVNLLEPRYHDLSNIPSGLDNPLGYRMVEFPFVNALIAWSYSITGGFDLSVAVFSRLWSIMFSLCSILWLYLLVRDLVSVRAGLLSALVFAILPFNLYFHTTVLPEVPLVFLSLLALWSWVRTVESFKSRQSFLWLTLFGLSSMAAMLLKPILIFFVPALVYYLIKRQGWSSLLQWQLWLTAFVVIAPLLGWRLWIQQFPEGIPASSWLFNGDGIRFKGAWFRWLFADRFGRLILGYWGLVPFSVGLVIKPKQSVGWFFHWLFAGVLAYLTIFATGNVTHDYYQIFIVPVLAIFVGLGLDELIFKVGKVNRTENIIRRDIVAKQKKRNDTLEIIEDDIEIERSDLHPWLAKLLGATCFLFMVAFGWFAIRDNFNINNPAILAAGEAVDRLVPADALVIAPYQGDTALLYQTNRSGWPIGFEIDQKISQGARYYISTAYDDETRELEASCQLVEQTDLYTLISLEECR